MLGLKNTGYSVVIVIKTVITSRLIQSPREYIITAKEALAQDLKENDVKSIMLSPV